MIKNLLPSLIATAAIIISGISLYMDCHQEAEMAEQLYLQNATTNPPRLELVKPLQLRDLHFAFDSLTISPPDSAFEIHCGVYIRGNLVFQNKGVSVAHLVGTIWADDYSGSAVARDILLDPVQRESRAQGKGSTDFYKFKRVPPADSISVPLDIQMKNFNKDSLTVLHVMLLYQDDMGALFDTYYWIRLKARDPMFDSEWQMLDGRLVLPVRFAKADVIVLGAENVDTYIYRLAERNQILSWLSDKFESK